MSWRTRLVLLVLLAPWGAEVGVAQEQAEVGPELWVARGEGFAAGAGEGLEVGPEGLTLAEGAEEGSWTAALPGEREWDRLLLSLNPDPFPAGSELRARVRVAVGGAWTPWLPLGVYGGGEGLPRSEKSEPALGVAVLVDEVVCREGPGRAAELRLELRRGAGGAPRLRRVVVDRWRRRPPAPDAARRSPAWGRTLDLPERSQTVEDPSISGRICSPTSLGMVLAFWGGELSTAQVAAGVYDHGAAIYGNWSFNAAFAALQGLEAEAVHGEGLELLEAEVAAGRPVVLSHQWRKGELSGAPVEESDGHLIAIVGFTAEGDVVVHDPAARVRQGQPVRRVYPRAELFHTWLENGEGVVYRVRPRPPR